MILYEYHSEIYVKFNNLSKKKTFHKHINSHSWQYGYIFLSQNMFGLALFIQHMKNTQFLIKKKRKA